MKHIQEVKLEDLEIGKAYKLSARNIDIGIWDGRSFHGIREKFNQSFIDNEIHYELSESFGTAKALYELK